MTPPVTAATRLFALLGDPVSHSLSPVFQNAALRALRLDGVYVALRCSADDVAGLIRALARAGGGGNVTVPHKEAAARAVERHTPAVELTGACNCFWLEGGEVWGDNTDVEGVAKAVRALVGETEWGSMLADRVLLVGAGGAARAALYALQAGGVEHVTLLNRSRARAEELKERWDTFGFRIDVAEPDDDLSGHAFDLAMNATSLGLRPDDPLPPTGGAVFRAALDLVYARGGETPWVRAMRAAGIRAADGTEVLVSQGAAAFRRWWAVDPPVEVMRQALRESAGGRGMRVDECG
ncbi:MAG TPA: shikimate dehydrogenase [Longimicrobium sp.]